MSPKSPSRARTRRLQPSVLFAALGDATRLALVGKLSSGQPASIAQLTAGSRLTRQAITKHLGVLRRAGMVHSTREGREQLFGRWTRSPCMRCGSMSIAFRISGIRRWRGSKPLWKIDRRPLNSPKAVQPGR